MQKKFPLFLLLALLLLGLASCGDGRGETEASHDPAITAVAQAAEPPANSLETEPTPASSLSSLPIDQRDTDTTDTTEPPDSPSQAPAQSSSLPLPSPEINAAPSPPLVSTDTASSAIPTATEEPEVKTEAVALSIYCMDHDVLETTETPWRDGLTVFDLTIELTRVHKIHMEFKGNGTTAYIAGIDNVYEFDNGPGSGWLYSVNGVFQGEGCGQYTLQPGDRVEWQYTLDMGKDLGASTE